MKLSELANNDKAIIVKVRGRGAFRKRIIEMGFVRGQEIEVVKPAPLKDPVQYRLMGYEVSLRNSEAELVEVIPLSQAETLVKDPFLGTLNSDVLKLNGTNGSKTINVALVGNPNCGKTTLFNYATGAKEHVGNYSGVTVDAKKAVYKQNGYTFNITDLPGTYSLSAYTPEELYVRKHILNELPDVVVNVIDSSSLERNMYLTLRLIDMDIKVIIALNMYDELSKRGDTFNHEALGIMLGIPIIPTVAATGKGIPELFEEIGRMFEDKNPIVRHIHINYGKGFEKAIDDIQQTLDVPENISLLNKVAARFIAINLLEKDKDTQADVRELKNGDKALRIADTYIKRIENHLKDDSETLITDARYGFIHGALKETFKPGNFNKHQKTKAIDDILTHKIWAIPIFIFFMWLMFQGTFTLGDYPMQAIEYGVTFFADLVKTYMPDGMLKDLLSDGIINGVGGVIVFLPNILLLFFFISLMEDTGYMARAAFITDRVMHKIGLHGKSFIPLVMGFGCNVPAIMATRTLESRNDRLLTMLINPLMSCSARMPVYLVVIGAIFPAYAGTALFAVYLFGIAVSVIVAKLFKKTIFRSEDAPFVMELPPYRMPVMRTTLKHMWHKGAQYLKKMGGIILIASIIIWALGYFPKNVEKQTFYETKIQNYRSEYTLKIEQEFDNNKKEILVNQLDSLVQNTEHEKHSALQAESYIGRVGKFIEPAIRPLGFDWRIGVSIVTGIAAKEIVVSTMGVLYGVGSDSDDTSEALKKNIREAKHDSGSRRGSPVFKPHVAVSFMIFILIYFPCIAVIAAIRRESGHWKWAVFTVVYTTLLAWLLSFAIFQIGELFL